MREFDLDLTPHDVQGLANADGIAAFFARLGYDTNARFVQTPENLGIASDSVTRPIRRIELIADQEAMLQVYLFELKSVTLTHTRNLAKTFRKFGGNFFIVLTSDYERIDFVLLEKLQPTPKKSQRLLGSPQVGIRPRILTVDRRNPGKVEMRVLRRFTYTESEPEYQYDKLLSAYSIADWSEENFNNRALFSDYYLTERAPDFPEWREDPKPAYLFFRDLYLNALNKYGQLKEDDLRPTLFEPIFKRLGFTWKVGKKAFSDSHDQADYLLMGQDGETLAVALTYPWERSLDGKDEVRDTDTPEENPNALVVSLLEKGDASWAIVTNGKVWRLYSAKTHSRATNYYEIDLEEIIAASGPGSTSLGESFRYFWLFFRASAFVLEEVLREGEPVRLSFLDRLLAESEEYAKELGERLKERIFARVFPHLAAGFIHNIREKEGRDADLDQARLDSIFQGTLTLLYRLLFLFYAESRDLLPAKETRGYFEASLSRIKREIRDISNDIEGEAEGLISRNYKDGSYGLYERLTRLFQVVAEGDSSLNVPVYNGGLFLTKPDPADTSAEAVSARFLADHQVPDRYLALALDRMARDVDDKKHSLVFVDYKSLGVRQLGSIYEGLLEFKVRIADKKYGVAIKKKVEVYVPFSSLSDSQKRKTESAGKVVNKGEVYLENDKRERKATGSYYTPDHIVKYIVENAVGPVLAEKFEALRPGLRAAEKKRKDFMARQEGLKKAGLPPEPESKADLYEPKLLDDFFDLKVLDPAMGSGHFLVQAVDFITDRTLDFLNAFPWNPIRVFLEETRRTIIEQMDHQGIDIDPKRLTDVNLLKRHVLKRCIYGVDLNPMAVELAKVSLWLDCFTLGAPLSFLDHHLRCGNSLIGVTVAEAREAVEWHLFGSRFTGMKLAVENMKKIGLLSDVTSEQVKESKSKYGDTLSILEPFKRILDVYTSQWFGNGSEGRGREPKALYFLKALEPEVQAFFEAGNKDELTKALKALGSEDREIAETALKSAKEKRFFHWELEFPEVFYGAREGTTQVIERSEGAGFDAVIGNPPYINAIELNKITDYEKPFWKEKMYSAAGAYDIYILFIEKSLELLTYTGLSSLITPNKFLSVSYADKIREYIYNEGIIHRIFDVSRVKTFDDPSVYPVVTLLSKCNRVSPKHIIVEKPSVFSIDKKQSCHQYSELDLLPNYIWGFLLSDGYAILKKILRDTRRFETICTINASTSTAEADLYGELIVEFNSSDKGWRVVNTGTIDAFESLWGKNQFTHKGDTFLKPILLDNSEIISNNRRRQYNSPKIAFAKIANEIEAFFDEDGIYASLNTNFVFTEGAAGYYYLGLCNSTLMTWVYEQYFGALRMSGGYLQFQAPQIRVLPILPYDETSIDAMEISNLSIMIQKSPGKKMELKKKIDQLVYQLYALDTEDINIIKASRQVTA